MYTLTMVAYEEFYILETGWEFFRHKPIVLTLPSLFMVREAIDDEHAFGNHEDNVRVEFTIVSPDGSIESGSVGMDLTDKRIVD